MRAIHWPNSKICSACPRPAVLANGSQLSVMNAYRLGTSGSKHWLDVNARGTRPFRHPRPHFRDTGPIAAIRRRKSCAHANLASLLLRDHFAEAVYICLAMELEQLSAE